MKKKHATVIAKPPHGSLDWLMIRHRDDEGRCTIGGSEAPALMDASPFMTRSDLYHAKRTRPKISETTAAMHTGNVLEPALVNELGRRLGVPLITPNLMYRRDRFTVTLDAVQLDEDGQAQIVGEVKTTRRHRISDITDVPTDYFWQCWAQMLVTDAPVHLIVLDRDMSISTHEIPRNEQALDVLRIESEKFAKAVDTESEGELAYCIDRMSAEQIADIVKPIDREVELTAEQYQWVRELADARDLKRQAETIEKAAKDHIARFLLDATIANYESRKVLSWKQQDGRESVDLAALKREHPDLVKAFTRQGEPSRVMRLSNTKGNN